MKAGKQKRKEKRRNKFLNQQTVVQMAEKMAGRQAGRESDSIVGMGKYIESIISRKREKSESESGIKDAY